MKRLYSYLLIAPLCAGILLSTGCGGGGAQTRYYALSPVKDTIQTQAADSRECPIVGIGVIKLPRYLDRPQIATNVSDSNEILLSEENRWVEPLSHSFPRILARNLCSLMCVRNVILYPWRTSAQPDYIVDIEVLRLDGAPGGNLYMEARWSVTKKGESPVIWRWTDFKEPTGGKGYESFVRAHSKAVGVLSAEIVKAIEAFPPGATGGK